MAKNLLIVESPAKAKTIEKYLGKDFTVKSSYGHIRDLDKGDKGVDVENGFKPKYVVTSDKKKVVKELKDHVKKSSEVWLATDEDREGEAISWHLCEVLGLNQLATKRIVFREITKPAIQKAIENPRLVDLNLVNAQQARRILDRLVGFELSEILWRKIKGKLSAGRVQSVAVRLVVDREREIQKFEVESFYKIAAYFILDDKGRKVELKAELPQRLKNHKEAQDFLEKCKDATFKVGNIEVKPFKRKPAAPFTTSTLQQEASRKLGFSVNRTMSNAQKLYEQGFISYMRTDSTSLSETALQDIATEVKKEYGEKFHKTRQFAGKNALAQEAHEAIRPTYAARKSVTSNPDMQRLYELIWKRTVASQMADAELERTQVSIDISSLPEDKLVATGEVLKFEGFLSVYIESKDDDAEEETKGILPPMEIGQELTLDRMTGTERFSRPPARYTEASLVKKLEELGIGRPSTYAPTITKIMEEERGYVVKENREGEERQYKEFELKNNGITSKTSVEITGASSNRLSPTDMGMLVTDFLMEHFGEIMDYSFTADIEKEFDIIASGSKEWNNMLSSFYKPFHDTVEETLQNAGRARGKRILGTDPKSGMTILTQMTRFGPVVQIGTREEVGEEGKPQFANLRPGQSLETIELEEALKLFELPKTLGNYEGQELSVGIGRYGPYVKHGESFVSIPRSLDPMEVDEKKAIEIILDKKKEDQPIGEFEGMPITKGKGRFGPFLKWNGMYVNIPKKFNPETIELDQALELIKVKKEKEANRYIQKWEKEKISIEAGRWGPFIRKGRKIISFPKVNGKKVDADIAKNLELEEVKKIIDGEMPESVAKKVEAAAKED